MKPLYLGVDLGGSNITAMLMAGNGKVAGIKKIQSQAHEGPGKVIRRIAELVQNLLQTTHHSTKAVKALGIGVPGVIDIGAGVVRYSPNLPGWKNIALVKELDRLLKIPIQMDNDANVAAFGEKWMGCGKAYDHVVMYTVGTGVGGGIIIDGKILHGGWDGAGEIGHMTIVADGPRCNCGNHGCLEALASATAIEREGRLLARKYSKSILARMQQEQNAMSAEMVFRAAKAGDSHALGLMQQVGTYLGIAVATIINLFNPQMIIIGGGVSHAGEMLLKPIRAEAKKRSMNELFRNVKIVKAQLADQAGVYGAVALAMHNNSKGSGR